jgi:lipopolysaccharide/colanic/teichoic acid biosynthesis glycosyltransferase
MLYFKRTFDFLAAFTALILFAPIIIICSILIYFKLGTPILFKQQRVGHNEDLFYIWKFRTMNNTQDKNGHLLEDRFRITKFGSFLRSYSLDELPQLMNVLIGNLSLVGPRPLLIEYLPLYSAEQRLRHSVMPGVTGWAQINGRNSIDWKTKFELDLYYVKNWSFWLDIKIIFMTISKVLRKDGIQQSEIITMPPFDGTN